MSEVIEFSFVYSKDAIKIKSFLGLIPRNIECINYIDVYNKLCKNDFLQTEPSDIVVSSYLMKQLQTILNRSTTKTLYYVLGNLDKDVIKGIKDHVESLTDKKVYYKFYHTSDVKINKSLSMFNEIIEFEVNV